MRDAAIDGVWPAPSPSNHGPPITVSAPHGRSRPATVSCGRSSGAATARPLVGGAAARERAHPRQGARERRHASGLLTPTLYLPLDFEITGVPSRFNHQISRRHFKPREAARAAGLRERAARRARARRPAPAAPRLLLGGAAADARASPAARAYRQTVYSARALPPTTCRRAGSSAATSTSLAEMHTACDYRLEVRLTLSADEARPDKGARHARKNVETLRGAGGVERMGTLLIEHLERARPQPAQPRPPLAHAARPRARRHRRDGRRRPAGRRRAARRADAAAAKRRQRELDRGFFAPKRIGRSGWCAAAEALSRLPAARQGLHACSANSAILEGRYVRGNVLEVSLAFARGAVAQAVEPADEMRHVFIVVNQLELAGGTVVLDAAHLIGDMSDDAQPPLKVREEIWRSKPVKVTRATRVDAAHGLCERTSRRTRRTCRRCGPPARAARLRAARQYRRAAHAHGDLDRPDRVVRCFDLKQRRAHRAALVVPQDAAGCARGRFGHLALERHRPAVCRQFKAGHRRGRGDGASAARGPVAQAGSATGASRCATCSRPPSARRSRSPDWFGERRPRRRRRARGRAPPGACSTSPTSVVDGIIAASRPRSSSTSPNRPRSSFLLERRRRPRPRPADAGVGPPSARRARPERADRGRQAGQAQHQVLQGAAPNGQRVFEVVEGSQLRLRRSAATTSSRRSTAFRRARRPTRRSAIISCARTSATAC